MEEMRFRGSHPTMGSYGYSKCKDAVIVRLGAVYGLNLHCDRPHGPGMLLRSVRLTRLRFSPSKNT